MTAQRSSRSPRQADIAQRLCAAYRERARARLERARRALQPAAREVLPRRLWGRRWRLR